MNDPFTNRRQRLSEEDAIKLQDAVIMDNLIEPSNARALYTAAEQYLSAETHATQETAIQALIKATNVIKGLEI